MLLDESKWVRVKDYVLLLYLDDQDKYIFICNKILPVRKLVTGRDVSAGATGATAVAPKF